MQQEGYLAHGIEQVGIEARYDEQVKRLLANKLILATIMQGCVEEYRGCTVTEIAGYIENEPEIGSVGVHADDTNRDIDGTIRGASTEDVTATEGVVRYDIRFYAKAPGEDGLISLIINVEAQNRLRSGLSIAQARPILLQPDDLRTVRNRIHQIGIRKHQEGILDLGMHPAAQGVSEHDHAVFDPREAAGRSRRRKRKKL